MFRNQVESTCVVLYALGLAVAGAPPGWADDGSGRPQARPLLPELWGATPRDRTVLSPVRKPHDSLTNGIEALPAPG